MKPRKQRFAASDKRLKSLKKVALIDTFFVVFAVVVIKVYQPELLQATVLGFSIFLIPVIFFTALIVKRGSVKHGNQMVRSFYAAEVGKFIVTTLLFAFSFIVIEPVARNVAVLFAAYFIIWLLHQVMTYLLVVKSRQN